MRRPTDIRVREVGISFADYAYRTPIKFGGRALDRATLLDVTVTAESASGATAGGFGSMPLGNVWAFPSRTLSYDETLGAMKTLAERIAAALPDLGGGEFLHPIDIGILLEERALQEAEGVSRDLGLAEGVPALAALVTGSPFDAAVHDAFGKANHINCYHGYGADFLSRDLSHYLDGDFAGEYLDRYVLAEPRPRMPLYHLVGALDPLVKADVVRPVGDGLPETLREWIIAEGLTHLKVKLNGEDLDWDVSRVLGVNEVTENVGIVRGPRDWQYSLDFNEKCANVEYLMEFLARIMEKSSSAFERIQYIEQPTARDLQANPENRMHAAAAVKPVVIDESLVDYESLLLAEEMGYSGVALKACKGQTQSLILGAAAQKRGMFLCVQDLTCVGASYLHSIGLAAHVPTVAAVEANGRQYCPAANRDWEGAFPEAFRVENGSIETAALDGPGLGIVPASGEKHHGQ